MRRAFWAFVLVVIAAVAYLSVVPSKPMPVARDYGHFCLYQDGNGLAAVIKYEIGLRVDQGCP